MAQDGLNELCRRFNIQEKKKPVESPERAKKAALPDGVVMERTRNGGNGAAFKKLWARDWEWKYSSQSEADMRLIGIFTAEILTKWRGFSCNVV